MAWPGLAWSGPWSYRLAQHECMALSISMQIPTLSSFSVISKGFKFSLTIFLQRLISAESVIPWSCKGVKITPIWWTEGNFSCCYIAFITSHYFVVFCLSKFRIKVLYFEIQDSLDIAYMSVCILFWEVG